MFDINKYKKATSVKEAVKFLAEDKDAKLLAGGTDIFIRLHHGKTGFSDIVDINGLSELKFVKHLDNHDIRIGSGTEFAKLMKNEIILKNLPALAIAAGSVGGPQIRNTATIGGNLCNGAISADSAAPLCVLDAILEIESIDKSREVSINQFYLGPGKLVIEQNEILKAILIKKENYENYGMDYYKYAMRKAMDIATIGCAAACSIKDNVINNLKLAYTVAAPRPMRCNIAETYAKGKTISTTVTDKIAKLALEDLNPRDSWRASKDFRTHIIYELGKKVITKAIEQCGESV